VSRTDGITILGTSVDGHAMTEGDGAGHYGVSRRDGKVRVDWRFAEVGPSVQHFELHYLVSGVAYRDGNTDVLRWRALPSEHKYGIDKSRIISEPAGANVKPPESRRVGAVSL